MATVNDYDDKRWRLIFFDANKKPKRKQLYFKKKSYYRTHGITKKQAEQLAWELEHAHRTGKRDLWEQQPAKDSIRIQDAIELWKRRAKKTLATSTITDRMYLMNAFCDAFGNSYLHNLKEEYVNKWINGPDKLATRNMRQGVVRSLVRSANRAGHNITINTQVLSTKAERKAFETITPVQYITESELEDLCAVHDSLSKKNHLQHTVHTNLTITHLFRILFYTGLRRSDILHLKPDWINNDYSILTIGDDSYIPKSQKNIEQVALLPKASDLLRTHIDLFPLEGISGDRLTKRFRKAADSALPATKAKHIHLHSLRHSFVMHCLDDLNLPERIVKQLTRHQDHRSFARYTHNNVHSVLQTIESRLKKN